MKKLNVEKILKKAVPLWMVFLIIVNTTLLSGFVEYYVLKKQLNQSIAQLAKTTKSPEELVQVLKQKVLPAKGYVTSLQWKDLGSQLVEAGAIDRVKFEASIARDDIGNHMKYMSGNWNDKVVVNEKNSRFMVDILWALGLTNKSKVLDDGPMKSDQSALGNFASTGGWTLGTKDAIELYSSKTIIPLTDKQQELVKKIAEKVFRPCCGNATYFPDCNHGMAALGYIELAVFNGLPEKQIYKDLLILNSFWFPQNYTEMAVYFNKQGTDWKNVDAKLVLSANYSSAQGASRIRQSVQSMPGISNQGGGCTA